MSEISWPEISGLHVHYQRSFMSATHVFLFSTWQTKNNLIFLLLEVRVTLSYSWCWLVAIIRIIAINQITYNDIGEVFQLLFLCIIPHTFFMKQKYNKESSNTLFRCLHWLDWPTYECCPLWKHMCECSSGTEFPTPVNELACLWGGVRDQGHLPLCIQRVNTA